LESRAALYLGTGPSLSLERIAVDAPRSGEVRVRLNASGVCHSDLHVVDGVWEVATPMVLGHEGAGVIESVGEDVRDLSVGDHVVLSWAAACGRCVQCLHGRPWACARTRADVPLMADGTTRLSRGHGSEVYPYLGVGSFSEYTVVAESAAIRISSEVPSTVAALIGCGVTTGVGAVINTAQVPAGAAAVVIGCGGVGLSAVMGLRLVGADPIVAVDLADDRLRAARDVGATHVFRGDDDVLGSLRSVASEGFDYAFEVIGLPATVELAISALGPVGTAVLVGMPGPAARAALDVYDLTLLSKRVVGCSYGSAIPAIDFPRIANLYLTGLLPLDKLVSHEIALDEVDDALAAMRRRERMRSVIVYA
jgi:S-(hydroxymethyl)glutathione dehydrogenase/alcohol dehydrogenase